MIRALKSWFAKPTPRPQRRTLLGVDRLECRDVPAANVWVGPAGGSWNTAANWSTGNIPSSTDTLYFGELGGTNTSSNDNIAGLTVAGVEQGNTFTGAITLNQKLTVSGDVYAYGTITVATGEELTAGNVYLYGTLNLQGSSSVTALSTGILDMPVSTSTLNTGGSNNVAMTVATVTMGSGSNWNVNSTTTETGTVGCQGTVTTTTAGSTYLTATAGFTDSGALNLNIGSHLVVGGTGTVELDGQTNMQIESAIQADTVEIGGTGVLTASWSGAVSILGDLKNNARIQFTNLNGIIQVSGDYTQGATGELDMQVQRTASVNGNDILEVTGSCSLDGSFVLTGAVTGNPAVDFIETNSGTGAFQSISLPAPAVSATWAMASTRWRVTF